MKKRLWLLALPIAFMACNNESTDSVSKADSTNEAKSDNDTSKTKTLAATNFQPTQ